MTRTDPLREAREALEVALEWWTPEDHDEGSEKRRVARTLARLDALPAPMRLGEPAAWRGVYDYPEGWYYPDAPSDGGDDA